MRDGSSGGEESKGDGKESKEGKEGEDGKTEKESKEEAKVVALDAPVKL